MTLKPFFRNVLRRPRTTIFVDINKIVSMLIRTVIKDSKKKKKELEIMYQNAIYNCIS